MDKKELIGNIQDLEPKGNAVGYLIGLKEAKRRCLSIANSLDESETKPVEVPDYVAEWYEDNKDDLEFKIWEYIYDWEIWKNNEFKEWMGVRDNKPLQTLIRMKNGYTIKSKQWVVRVNGRTLKHLQFYKDGTPDPLLTPFFENGSSMTFTDKSKAEAVATLVEGSVEEV